MRKPKKAKSSLSAQEIQLVEQLRKNRKMMAHVTMICTVGRGARRGKRPREWKEIRLVAAQAQGSTKTVYAATFGNMDQTGRRWGHCARQAG